MHLLNGFHPLLIVVMFNIYDEMIDAQIYLKIIVCSVENIVYFTFKK
jgi:hypothetical protein